MTTTNDAFLREFVLGALRDDGFREGERNDPSIGNRLYHEFLELENENNECGNLQDTEYWMIRRVCIMDCVDWTTGIIIAHNWIDHISWWDITDLEGIEDLI